MTTFKVELVDMKTWKHDVKDHLDWEEAKKYLVEYADLSEEIMNRIRDGGSVEDGKWSSCSCIITCKENAKIGILIKRNQVPL